MNKKFKMNKINSMIDIIVLMKCYNSNNNK